MDRQNRRELLEVIEQQKEQLSRYEARLKDVVRAYKGLSKEKETLETTLKAISTANETEKGKDAGVSGAEGDASDAESLADSQASSDNASFKSKLGALSASLASISQEKAQNEAKFVTERRRLKKEKDELQAQLTAAKAAEESLRSNLENVKSKLIIERHEREQETNNNKLMMQELQKLLADERNQKERLADQLHNRKPDTSATIHTEQKPEESRVQELVTELKQVKEQLWRSKEQLKEQDTTKQQLRQLQQQLLEVRQQHQEQLRSAEVAREAAELRALEIQQQQEHRVGNLEFRLQELSSSLADYQRLRENDQTDINRMRIKIDALSDENSLLARSVSAEPPPPEVKEDEAKEAGETEKLVEKVRKMKQVLQDRPVDPDVLEKLFSLPVHAQLRSKVIELEAQTREPEKEMRRSAPGLYEDFLAASAQTAQLENIKAQNDILKSKLSEARNENSRLEAELKDKSLKLLELKQQGENDKDMVRMENRKQVGMLKFELQQQRERSLVLLEEKDAEIQRLQGELERTVEDAFYSPERTERSSPLVLPARKISCDIGEMNAGPTSSGAPLHYVQELSRKEVEIKELRSQQYQTETTLRELQLTMSTKEEKYQERIEDLEDTITRLERMTTSEGANLEYLKNVVLTYMLSTDAANRNHMLKAIGAVLRLTKAEMVRVKEHNAAWWWQQSKLTPPKKK